MNETTLTEPLTGELPINLLKEGHPFVNFINATSFYSSGKTLSEYLKDLIVVHIADDSFSWSIVEEREEYRSTDYIQNPRPIHTIVVQNSTTGIRRSFSFDKSNLI